MTKCWIKKVIRSYNVRERVQSLIKRFCTKYIYGIKRIGKRI